MAGLCGHPNLTIGFETVAKDIFKEENILKGRIGRLFDSFFIHKGKRNCKFLSSEKYFVNLTGMDVNDKILYLLDNKIIDMWYWTVDYPDDEDLMEVQQNLQISKTTTVASYRVAQLMKKNVNSDKSDLSSFLVVNIVLLLVIIAGYVIDMISMLIIFKMRGQKFAFVDLLFHKEASVITSRLTLLAYRLFLFINLNCLRGMIKTSTIIVDTSEFLDSIDKLNKTSKTLITFNSGSEGIFNRILHRLKDPVKCIYLEFSDLKDEFFKTVLKNGVENYFFWMFELQTLGIMDKFSLFTDSSQFMTYLQSSSYYEALNANFMRHDLTMSTKRLIDQRVDQSFEHGLYLILDSKLSEMYRPSSKSGHKLYESLDKYIDDNTKEASIEVDNFRRVLIIFIAQLVILLIAFFLPPIYRRTFKRIRKKIFPKRQFIVHASLHSHQIKPLNTLNFYTSSETNDPQMMDNSKSERNKRFYYSTEMEIKN